MVRYSIQQGVKGSMNSSGIKIILVMVILHNLFDHGVGDYELRSFLSNFFWHMLEPMATVGEQKSSLSQALLLSAKILTLASTRSHSRI